MIQRNRRIVVLTAVTGVIVLFLLMDGGGGGGVEVPRTPDKGIGLQPTNYPDPNIRGRDGNNSTETTTPRCPDHLTCCDIDKNRPAVVCPISKDRPSLAAILDTIVDCVLLGAACAGADVYLPRDETLSVFSPVVFTHFERSLGITIRLYCVEHPELPLMSQDDEPMTFLTYKAACRKEVTKGPRVVPMVASLHLMQGKRMPLVVYMVRHPSAAVTALAASSPPVPDGSVGVQLPQLWDLKHQYLQNLLAMVGGMDNTRPLYVTRKLGDSDARGRTIVYGPRAAEERLTAAEEFVELNVLVSLPVALLWHSSDLGKIVRSVRCEERPDVATYVHQPTESRVSKPTTEDACLEHEFIKAEIELRKSKHYHK